MTKNNFFTGMGVGILAGATIGMALSANNGGIKKKASSVIRRVGDAVNDLSDNMDM